MNARALELNRVTVAPGEYHVLRGEGTLLTVLGSCVCACLRDPFAGVGGMNHFLLPRVATDLPLPISEAARYGVNAMELLINALIKRGARKDRLEAKIFGGGRVLDAIVSMDIGARNAAFVLDFLARETIPVLGRDLLGLRPRKIAYVPSTGEAYVKYLDRIDDRLDALAAREREFADRLRLRSAPSVDLFS